MAAAVLQILHQNRVWQTQKFDQQTAAWLKQLEESHLLYSTPKDMNDDMFWIYATIRFRSAARLVRPFLCHNCQSCSKSTSC
jgi:hypothetical protein